MKQLLELLRRNPWFFLCVTLAALALRLFFVFKFPSIYGDSLVYGDIAKNWMNHGIYGLSTGQGVHPTLIRLPGYPAFLALIFSVAGQEHYTAVMIAQALIDTNTCLVIAALALELMNARAAKAAYLLAALCPFTAAYTAAPLTETVAIWATAHALYYGVRGIRALQSEPGNRGLMLWLLAGVWTAAGILFRPDGGIVLAALAAGLVMLSVRSKPGRPVLLAGVVLVASSVAPLAPWTVRNWRTFHVIQPLAPRYANDPGDFVPRGFNRWIKTWIVDYVSVHEIYWRGETDTIDADLLPEQLAVRGPAPGDRIHVPAVGTRKVHDVLIDARVPREARPTVPLVTAGETVLWVAGVVRGSAALVSPTTRRVVRLVLHSPALPPT